MLSIHFRVLYEDPITLIMMNVEDKSTMKRFSCSFCEYSTDNKGHLTRHRRIHTGEKPFKCKHCDKSFSVKSNLIYHERLHTGEKPYQCKHCDKSFAQSSALAKHERTHDGKKYTCKNCRKSFANSRNFNRHKKKYPDCVIKEEPSTESYVLNESMYNPPNEVHHNVMASTENHEILSQSENNCEETVYIAIASNQDVKEEIIQDVKTECFPDDNNVFTCDVCQEVFSEKVFFVHAK